MEVSGFPALRGLSEILGVLVSPFCCAMKKDNWINSQYSTHRIIVIVPGKYINDMIHRQCCLWGLYNLPDMNTNPREMKNSTKAVEFSSCKRKLRKWAKLILTTMNNNICKTINGIIRNGWFCKSIGKFSNTGVWEVEYKWLSWIS